MDLEKNARLRFNTKLQAIADVRSFNAGRFDPVRHIGLLESADKCIAALPVNERRAAAERLERMQTEPIAQVCLDCGTPMTRTTDPCNCG